MAQLAIRGHATRGREVIELLKMLGGKISHYFGEIQFGEIHNGSDTNCFYYIKDDSYIDICKSPSSFDVILSLEEFLKNFPYKVGDKVLINDDTNDVHTITSMVWDINRVAYRIQAIDGIEDTNYWFAYEMMPYEEEIMKETDPISPTSEINLNHPCFGKCNEIELIIPDGWEFKRRGNKMFGVRKQYPKTYEECCEVLGLGSYFEPEIRNATTKECNEIMNFMRLKRCRNAYWKIAGEEMGLDEPWKPDWTDNYQKKWIINFYQDEINFTTGPNVHFVFAFPTAEMRDAFFENFKNLVELVKELL